MSDQGCAHRAASRGHARTPFFAVVVVTLSALVLSACGKSEDEARRAFAVSELPEIVRGAGGQLTLVDAESGPQTLAEVADEISISPATLRTCGFVAAAEAVFDGPAALPYTASVILFADPEGASCFLRSLRDLAEADPDVDPSIDARSFGAEALGLSLALEFFVAHLYAWRLDNLVLSTVSASQGAREFAERLDARANAAG